MISFNCSVNIEPYYICDIKWHNSLFCMMLCLFFYLKSCIWEDETISIIHARVAQHTDFMGSACVISVICICALSNFTLTQLSICCQACCLLQVAAAVLDFSFKRKSSYLKIQNTKSWLAPHGKWGALTVCSFSVCSEDMIIIGPMLPNATSLTCTTLDWANLGWFYGCHFRFGQTW